LEAEHIDIGVVEGIVGISEWNVTIEGFANHAGTTAMNNRRDALLAAAKFIEAVNHVVTSIPGRQVGTVGRIQAFPGAPNVIPGKVILTLELRDLDAAKIQTLYQKVRAEADQIAQASKVTFDFSELVTNIPAPTDPRVRALIDSSAKELGLTTKLMPSGAGHDAQDMARIGPVGMIFIPSIGGISHSPKEFSRPQDTENGANVLLHALLKLDSESRIKTVPVPAEEWILLVCASLCAASFVQVLPSRRDRACPWAQDITLHSGEGLQRSLRTVSDHGCLPAPIDERALARKGEGRPFGSN